MKRRTLTFILTFALVLVLGFTFISIKGIGYTYDHGGKVIYSTEGFTVNETPYIYSDLGIANTQLLSSPSDLFVYNQDEEFGTVLYLLDGSEANATAHSTLFLLDRNLHLQRQIDYLVYNPADFTDDELKTIKSGATNVVGDKEYVIEVGGVETKAAGFATVEEVRANDYVPLVMSGASAICRFYKTNTVPFTDYIYICDTSNNQVLVVDATSYDPTLNSYRIVQIVTSPVEEIGDTSFKPIKVTADSAGRIYVISNGVTNGIMEFSVNGTFDRYVGTNYVALSAWDIFWRNFSTESQLASQTSILPTTFTSMIYKNNMIYTTSYVVTSSDGNTTNDKIMIKKINPSGKDVLRRNGYTVPKGDYTYYKSNDSYGTYGPSRFEGITVNDYGVYTVVDSNRGRLFTYDNEGNLLYISGGTGTQIDKISIPEAIQYLGEDILVLDSKKKSIIRFEPTEIARVINKAVECEYNGRTDGDYDEHGNYVPGAYDYWEEVILLNANYEYAYVGIGRHYMNVKEYKTAMYYYKLGYHQINYGKAFKEYRNAIIKANFTWFIIVFAVVVAGGLIGRKIYRKKKGIVEEEMTGIGDE